MNKNVVAVFAAVCGVVMITSCDTPKDLRPETKVSVDYVQPGTRNTHNVGAVNEVHGHGTQHQEVMPNHDEGVNTIQPQDSVKETGVTNTAAGAVRH